MNRIDLFNQKMKESVENSDSPFEPIEIVNYRYYYPNEYADPIIEYYGGEDKSGEFKKVRGHDYRRICSVCSSARLCFLYLKDKNAKFEVHLNNATGKGTDTQLDALVGDTYYECKCQEVVEGEGQRLKGGYKDLLTSDKEFAIKNIAYNMYDDTLSFNLRDMGTTYDEDYDKTHFNTKQLFAHLLAIAKEHKNEKKTLQYVIFKPKKELIKDTILENVYKELEKEIKAIWNSDAIKNFLSNHKNITLNKPLFVYVDGDSFIEELVC